MNRAWNFSAGPSALPLEVLQQAANEMTNWNGTGISVMELSHRSQHFEQIRSEAEADLRTLLQVPDDFAVLFMQGGATGINAILPLNLVGLNGSKKADYVLSGSWSLKSYNEAKRYADVAVAASSEGKTIIDGHEYQPYTWFAETSQWQVRADTSYLHICSNETISGAELSQDQWPDMVDLNAEKVPLVVDASSNFLSRSIDFNKASIVYAGAQKNAGPAGVTIVIIKRDLLGHALDICPSAFNFANVAKANSMFNTPPTYAIYIAGLVFKWILKQGGVAAIEQANIAKADALYDYIDGSDFYYNSVAAQFRSRMNIPFLLKKEGLNSAFLSQAENRNLVQLKGHKSVGGMRASIYNAMPLQGVQELISFMQDFKQHNV